LRKTLFLLPFLFFALELRSDFGQIEKGIREISSFTGLQPPDAYDKLIAKVRLREQWHPALKKINSVKIEHDLRWEDVEGGSFDFRGIVNDFLSITGISLQERGDYDGVLRIKANFRPLGKSYPQGFLYTGAEVKGTMIFETKWGFRMEERFEGRVNPPKKLGKESKEEIASLKKAKNAPFSRAISAPGSFLDKFARMYYRCFGPYALASAILEKEDLLGSFYYQLLTPFLLEIRDSLIEPLCYLAVNSKGKDVRARAAAALMELKAIRAIPILLSSLVQLGKLGLWEYIDNILGSNHQIGKGERWDRGALEMPER